MNEEDQIAELLLCWEESCEQGQEVSADELCRDCPQLVVTLVKRISALKATAWMENRDGGKGTPQLEPPTLPPSRTLAGRYRLDEKIAEGGFAEVWKAFDLELCREVAVKLPKRNRLHSAEEFVAEARRVARLKHPGVVPVFDVGKDGDIVFIVSEFVEGGSLAQRIAKDRIPTSEAVRLVAEIAETLAYTHDQGIIHRDIKPGNILLDQHGRALLTDFGIAYSQEKSSDRFTFGTLAYMAPEQADGNDVDERSDIYSLGVVFYELLTGGSPYRTDSPVALRRRIASDEPINLSGRVVPPIIARICLKCLAKKPADRHASAQEVARLLRLALMRKRGRWGWLLFAVASLTVVMVAGQLLNRPTENHIQSIDKRDPAAVEEAEVGLWQVPNVQITSVVFSPNGEKLLSGGLDGVVRLWNVKTGAEERAFPRQKTWVRCVAFSPDGKSVFACCGGAGGNSLTRWDTASGQELNQYTGHTKPLICLAVSPDGRWLVSGGDGNDECSLRLWEVESGKQLHDLHGHVNHVCGVGFSKDSGAIVSGGLDGVVRLWSLASGRLVRTYAGHQGGIQSAAISPNGTRIVSGGLDGMVRLWNEQTAKEIHCFEGHQDEVMGVRFSPNGARILSGSLDGTVRLWDVATLRELECFRGHVGGVTSVAFSPDGQRAVSSGQDGTIRSWRLPD